MGPRVPQDPGNRGHGWLKGRIFMVTAKSLLYHGAIVHRVHVYPIGIPAEQYHVVVEIVHPGGSFIVVHFEHIDRIDREPGFNLDYAA